MAEEGWGPWALLGTGSMTVPVSTRQYPHRRHTHPPSLTSLKQPACELAVSQGGHIAHLSRIRERATDRPLSAIAGLFASEEGLPLLSLSVHSPASWQTS